MKREIASTQGKPVLNERTLQQLLSAAYTLQEHHGRLPAGEHHAHPEALSDRAIAESVRSIQVGPLTPEPIAKPEAVALPGPAIPVMQADAALLAPRNDSVTPLETAHQLFVLASRLDALIQQGGRTDSEWRAQLPVAVAREMLARGRLAGLCQPEVPAKVVLKQRTSQLTGPVPPAEHAVPVGTNLLRFGNVRGPIARSNEFFRKAAGMVATAAVLGLLLGASIYRIEPC